MSIGTINLNPALMKMLAGQKSEIALTPESLLQLLAQGGEGSAEGLGELNSLEQNNNPLTSPTTLFQEGQEINPEMNFKQLMNSLKDESANKEIILKKSESLSLNKTQIPSDLPQNNILNFVKENPQDVLEVPVLEKENERTFFPNSGTNKKIKNDLSINNNSEGKRSFFNPEISPVDITTRPNISPEVKEFKNNEVLKTQILNSSSVVSPSPVPSSPQITESMPISPATNETITEITEPLPLEIELSPTSSNPAVHHKKNISNIYLKNSDNIPSLDLSGPKLEDLKEGENEVKLDSSLPPQLAKARGRGIPASYKTESPFIQMKRNDKNIIGESNIPSNGDSLPVIDSSTSINSLKTNNFNSLALNKSNSNVKTLDLSSVDKSDVPQIINRIANFVESNKISGKNGLDLVVRHEEIGEFKIHTQQSERPGVVDLEIVGQSTKAHQFFSENENKLLQSLDAAGVKLGEFKISGPGHTFQLNSESILSNTNNSSFGNSDNSSFQGQPSRFSDTMQGQQGGERRRELWKQAQEQYNDQYKSFQRKAA